ncbi:MAG: glycosyltransferase family 2 protein [Deltaproteobacteria bacterium]
MKLSVVIPVFNGAATIARLVEEIARELGSEYDLEIVLVNDGSPLDNSAEVCRAIADSSPQTKFLDLSRNFGEHNAVMAGFNYCTGDAAVVVDDDFQNPPSEIAKLVEKLNDGYDVVFSRYVKKRHHAVRNLGSWFNNLVASILIHKPMDLYLSSFKAVNRFLLDELVKYTGPYPYIDGLILRISRNYATVQVRHDARVEGRSSYTVRKLCSLWLNMFTNFSILPLRLAVVTGCLLAFAGMLVAVYSLIERLSEPNLPPGWASIMISLLVVSGVQLVAIGMVGEYLGRMFMKDNGNPQFVVRDSVNCGSPVQRSSRAVADRPRDGVWE